MHPGEEPIPDMSPPPDYARILGRLRAAVERVGDAIGADRCSMCGDPVGDDGGYLVEADELVPFCAECLVTR